jgi:hypothetical protein
MSETMQVEHQAAMERARKEKGPPPLSQSAVQKQGINVDSELNVLSQAQDVAFQLRSDLFRQCTGDKGPAQFANMAETFKQWKDMASSNSWLKASGTKLTSQLLPFYVDRKPGAPVV